MGDPLWSRAKLGGRIEMVSADTGQGDDGRHGLPPQVIGILGTGQRSSLMPLRHFTGHHLPSQIKTRLFFPYFVFQKKTKNKKTSCFQPMYVLYCVLWSPHRCPVSLPRRLHSAFPPPSGSSYRSVFRAVANEFDPDATIFVGSHLSITFFPPFWL